MRSNRWQWRRDCGHEVLLKWLSEKNRFTVEWHSIVLVQGLHCVGLSFEYYICRSQRPTGTVIMNGCFAKRPELAKQFFYIVVCLNSILDLLQIVKAI